MRVTAAIVAVSAMAAFGASGVAAGASTATELKSAQAKLDALVAQARSAAAQRDALQTSLTTLMGRIDSTRRQIEATGAQVAVRHIVYPTDLSEESAGAAPYVAALAAAYGAGVTVLHVMPEETAANPDAQKLAEPLRAGMVRLLERHFAGIKSEFVLEVGDTVETILNCVRRNHADLIAMGIRNAFMPGFQLRASVAYRVIAAAPCPVLTCRP